MGNTVDTNAELQLESISASFRFTVCRLANLFSSSTRLSKQSQETGCLLPLPSCPEGSVVERYTGVVDNFAFYLAMEVSYRVVELAWVAN
jgi:hypothetical protein